MSSFFSKTSDYFEGLSNKAKNRYKEKLQAVGLGIQDDSYKPERRGIIDLRNPSYTPRACNMSYYPARMYKGQSNRCRRRQDKNRQIWRSRCLSDLQVQHIRWKNWPHQRRIQDLKEGGAWSIARKICSHAPKR